MDMEATNEICDNRPILPHSAVSQRSIEIQIQPRSPTIKETIVQIPLKPIKSSSDSSPTTEAASTTTPTATADVKKRNLKLDLKTPSIEESGSGGGGEGGSGCDGDTTTSRSSRRNDNSTSDNENGSAKQRHDSASSSGSVEDENAKNNNEIRSPMSPRSPGNQGELTRFAVFLFFFCLSQFFTPFYGSCQAIVFPSQTLFCFSAHLLLTTTGWMSCGDTQRVTSK